MINKKISINFFFILIIVLFVTFLYQGIINFKFSIIDDHQIVALLGPDNYLDLKNFQKYISNVFFEILNSKLRTTLINIYWPIETFMFQNDAKIYYIFRLIIVTIFFITLFNYSQKYIDSFSSLLLTLIFIQSNSIFDILTRIIVPEFITLLSLIFLIPLFFKFLQIASINNQNEKVGKKNLFLYFVFFGILIFSKESALPIIILPLLFTFILIKKNNKNYSILISNFLVLLIFFYYIYLNINLILNDTSSIKGVINLELFNLLKILFKFIKYILSIYFIHIGIIIYFYFKLKKNNYSSIIFLFFLINIIIIFYQFIIYNGSLPSGIRYDFFLDLLFFFNTFFLIKFVQKFNLKIKDFKIKNFVIFFLVLLLFLKLPNVIETNDKIMNKKNELDYFHLKINEIKDLAHNNRRDIILRTYNVWDYELISSIYKYLRYKNIDNNLYLKLEFTENNMKNELELIFFNRLKDVSLKKNLNWSKNHKNDWDFENIENLTDKETCIEIILLRNEKKIKKNCQESVKYIYRPS